jgi:hypothetical protein
MVEYTITEGVEPGLHAVGEVSRTWDEFDGSDSEAGCFEETKVDFG